ncbi:LCP family protein [Streptomyces sp. CC208A]|uniref:LCP family protein n=1 Tax=Streptomyces sp. CC208A TaxID=3044573 RepID=UPI0024A883F6|nr:LCP family protein [Streptomyces sp. CC208A]
MGQNSVRREGTRPSVPHARDRGWDDDLHGAGEATGAGGTGTSTDPGPATASVPAPGGRAARRRGGGGDSGPAGAAVGAGGRAAARRQAKKAGKKKALRWSAIAVSVVVLGTAAAGYAYYEHLNDNIRSGGRAGGESGVKKAVPNALGDTPLNILLIGSDSRADEKNIALGGSRKDKDRPPLADVQMLLHVSADRQNASLISIPRDTVVKIPDCKGEDGTAYPGTTDRPINETLARGGPGCTLTTWETLTGVYIDHWMMVDFAGVVAMADEVGGVPVCVKTGVYDRSTAQVRGGSGLKLPAGTTEVQGEQALQWLRTRHAFGSDQNRAKAQHMYLNGMLKKLQQQNAWTDTGRLMGLAETGTKALQVSDGLDTVAKLFDLGMQLKNVKVDRLSTVTIPTDPYPPNPKAWLQPRTAAAEKIWGMLREDVALDKNGDKAPAKPKADAKPRKTAAAPAALPVTVVNGTAGNDEPPVEGRAKDISAVLTEKGFAQAGISKEPKPSKGTVVAYPKDQGDQGRADAESVAAALGLPPSTVRADGTIQGITLVVGADWREGTTYQKKQDKAGDLPEGADDKADCMDVYSVYKWDGEG